MGNRELFWLIWAGHKTQAIDYMKKNELEVRPERIVSADNPHKVRGIQNAIVIRVGTWYTHKNADDFTRYLVAHRLTVVDEFKIYRGN